MLILYNNNISNIKTKKYIYKIFKIIINLILTNLIN